MIRRGRTEGWLRRQPSALAAWANHNQVTFHDVSVETLKDHEAKGAAIVASRHISTQTHSHVLKVPRDLIMSKDSIENFASCDRHLSQVLEATRDLSGRATRTAIMVFLLVQVTIICPEIPQGVGQHSSLTDYITFLPDELLPTLWHEEELGALRGTSLYSATKSKLRSLDREFEIFRTATMHLQWCRQFWWDNELLTLDDWKAVDAMYRSRALEFPGIGDSMVPCIDMANHASGEKTGALYESDVEGSVVLQLRENKVFEAGDEITITYGDEKAASEMIFSYGFLEDTLSTARALFLDLDIPDDDPLKPAKAFAATSAPGVRIFERGSGVEWESDYVYLACANEEDGLEFKVVQTNDGERKLQAFWNENIVKDDVALKSLLIADPLREVFELRAVALVQDRVEKQLQSLHESEMYEHSQENRIARSGPMALAKRLRELESQLLEKAYERLEDDKLRLFKSDPVQDYLQSRRTESASQESDVQEDFL